VRPGKKGKEDRPSGLLVWTFAFARGGIEGIGTAFDLRLDGGGEG
jgi:hypothetical protein